MKALVCTQFGAPSLLEFRDHPSPTAGADDVIVAVKAASVNFPDVLITAGTYQFKPPPPFVPGSELGGVVAHVGSAAATDVRVGDRVMAFITHGAFAEYVRVPAERVVRIPAAMSFEVAGSLLLTYGTMHHALADRAAVSAGETVLVLGAGGGIGIAAIEVAKASGARVIAAASAASKLHAAREHGADEELDYSHIPLREALRTLTGNAGVDVVVDPVGGELSEAALRSLAWRGRHLVIGFAAGNIPRIPLNLPLLKGAAIVGVFWGDFVRREPAAFHASMRQLLEWYAQGKLRPHVSAVYPLARGAEAIARVARREVVGKIVIVT